VQLQCVFFCTRCVRFTLQEVSYDLETNIVSSNVLRIKTPEKLKVDDFYQFAPVVDSIIIRFGDIRLLIDASAFNGWENIAVLKITLGS
jgi:hypothetical protein